MGNIWKHKGLDIPVLSSAGPAIIRSRDIRSRPNNLDLIIAHVETPEGKGFMPILTSSMDHSKALCNGPVTLGEDRMAYLKALNDGRGLVKENMPPRVFVVHEGPHAPQLCIRANDLSEDECTLIQTIVCNKWSDSDDYKAKVGASPFLQGFQPPSWEGDKGRVLVEFWSDNRKAIDRFVDHVNARFAKEIKDGKFVPLKVDRILTPPVELP